MTNSIASTAIIVIASGHQLGDVGAVRRPASTRAQPLVGRDRRVAAVERQQRDHVEQPDEHVDARRASAGGRRSRTRRRSSALSLLMPTTVVGRVSRSLFDAGEVADDVDRVEHLDHAVDALPRPSGRGRRRCRWRPLAIDSLFHDDLVAGADAEERGAGARPGRRVGAEADDLGQRLRRRGRARA